MIYSHAERWIYIGPPRTGSSALHRHLVEHHGGTRHCEFQHCCHQPFKGAESYKVLLSVRHPVSRALSAYRLAKANHLYDNFRDFLAPRYKFYHRPMSFYARPWVKDLRLLRLESLDDDLATHLGDGPKVQKVNESRGFVGVSDEEVAMIRNMWAADFERFNYA